MIEVDLAFMNFFSKSNIIHTSIWWKENSHFNAYLEYLSFEGEYRLWNIKCVTCLTRHIERVWQENVNYMTYLTTMYLTFKVTWNLKLIIWTVTSTNITAIFFNMEVTNYPFWDIRGCQKLITSHEGYETLE